MLSNKDVAINNEPVTVDGLDDIFRATDDPGLTLAPSSVDQGMATGEGGKIGFPPGGLKLSEAAKTFNVTVRTVQRWIKEGRLKACKVDGVHGPEWRVMGESSADNKSDQPLISGDDDEPQAALLEFDGVYEGDSGRYSSHDATVERMASIIENLTEKLEKAQKELQGASYRNGYLEAQTESYKNEIKLLTDREHYKRGWWARFAAWFIGKK